MSAEEGTSNETEVQAGWMSIYCNEERCGGSLVETDPNGMEEECAVCIESLEGLSVAINDPCRHVFCKSCIDDWNTKWVVLNVSRIF